MLSWRGKRAERRASVLSWSVRVVAGAVIVLSIALATRARGANPAKGIEELEQDKAHAPLVAEPLAKAKAAEERARRFRSSGDEPRARSADALAATRIDAARETIKAQEAEARAEAEAARVADAGRHVERERALVEEAMMQNGRLRAQLDGLEREARGESDAGTPKPDGGKK
jgi:hypothetical protein